MSCLRQTLPHRPQPDTRAQGRARIHGEKGGIQGGHGHGKEEEEEAAAERGARLCGGRWHRRSVSAIEARRTRVRRQAGKQRRRESALSPDTIHHARSNRIESNQFA